MGEAQVFQSNSASMPARLCPRRGSDSVSRSRAGAILRSLPLLRIRVYRCMDCWHRFLGVPRAARPARRFEKS